MDTSWIIYAAIGGYFLGAIPFGFLLSRAMGQGDIRNIGSGNIGATNVLRTGRKDLAIITLVLDAGKAAVSALIFWTLFGYEYGLIAAVFALIGHCFPIWLKFKGGKGVATFFGALLAVSWPVGLIAAAIWIACAVLTRISSLSALAAAALSPGIALLLDRPGGTYVAMMAVAMTLIIYIRHKDNIIRIVKGTESKIGSKSGPGS